jgi:hypothetical protein
MHELPDRPTPYQGPPALERRESNRSRHEVRRVRGPLRAHLINLLQRVEQPSDRRVPPNSRTENYTEGSGTRRVLLDP